MIRPRTSFALLAAEAVASIVISLIALATLPARVPIHFDFAGRPDAYGSASLTAWIMPLTLVLTATLTAAGTNKVRDLEIRWRLAATLAVTGGLFLGLHILILLLAGGYKFDMLRATAFGLAAMMAGLGPLLPGTPKNEWFGVRTPATFSSPEAWDRIHRVVGRQYTLYGLALLVLSLLPIPGVVTLLLTTTAIILIPLLPRR